MATPTGPKEYLVSSIRKRPAMYLGSTNLFGIIQYLVCPVALLLEQGAKQITATADDGYVISADVPLTLADVNDGLSPFEVARPVSGFGYEGAILNALSEELHVSINSPGRS